VKIAGEFPPIGYDLVFCDSCIGGSSIARKLSNQPWSVRALYLADYAVNPLGTKRPSEISRALQRWVDFSAGSSKTLVIACNTASIRLTECPDVRSSAVEAGLSLVSMVDLLDRALAAAHSWLSEACVCLMGTEFTVRQGLYRERLLTAGATEVRLLAATQTERMVAHLQHTSREGKRAVVAEISNAIRGSEVVVLGCTCFPLITDLIREINPTCKVIDPADGIDDFRFGRTGCSRHLTIVVSGPDRIADHVRTCATQLFPRWQIEDVLLWHDADTTAQFEGARTSTGR
jgi:glutamate racemase